MRGDYEQRHDEVAESDARSGQDIGCQICERDGYGCSEQRIHHTVPETCSDAEARVCDDLLPGLDIHSFGEE